ncbi:hypothetical protein [Kribbella sindirgiensis]|uniref:Uncharacterized protein n=1 Tax=Kribbella sindirgiensis TaxID=1124744 RepID=A0A4R0I3C1_9ACTN|nr:hypothetical protein [Kribbella sindirgiensis]TCC19991.1 hypothetical protein E0H50_37855 [Kribbella sindirgiensis]
MTRRPPASSEDYDRGWDDAMQLAAADVDDMARLADMSGSSLIEASDIRILAERLREEAEHSPGDRPYDPRD